MASQVPSQVLSVHRKEFVDLVRATPQIPQYGSCPQPLPHMIQGYQEQRPLSLLLLSRLLRLRQRQRLPALHLPMAIALRPLQDQTHQVVSDKTQARLQRRHLQKLIHPNFLELAFRPVLLGRLHLGPLRPNRSSKLQALAESEAPQQIETAQHPLHTLQLQLSLQMLVA